MSADLNIIGSPSLMGPMAGGRRAIMAAMSPSILATACKVSFHRRSSSPATSRPRALEVGEFREDELNGLLHAFVRILLDPVAPDLDIACGHTELALNAGWDRELLAIELQALIDMEFSMSPASRSPRSISWTQIRPRTIPFHRSPTRFRP
jgi:hypothetical protein